MNASKRALRASLRARLAALPPATFSTGALQVVPALLAFCDAVPGAGAVALFASRAGEIATAPLDDALRMRGTPRALPLIAGDALVFKRIPADVAVASLPLDRFGIPSPHETFDDVVLAGCAVVVPGLGFDAHGGRLGYGRGFYDRALVGVALDRCVGLCLDEQVVDAVPTEPHDVRLRFVCTPARGVFRTSV